MIVSSIYWSRDQFTHILDLVELLPIDIQHIWGVNRVRMHPANLISKGGFDIADFIRKEINFRFIQNPFIFEREKS